MDLTTWTTRAIEAVQAWQAQAGPIDVHEAVRVDPDRLAAALDELVTRLARSQADAAAGRVAS